MNKLFDIILKLGIITILIIAIITKQQYSYYFFLRWAVFASSIYFAYKTRNQIGIYGIRFGVIFFSAVIILFNPFIPFNFQKTIWRIIDLIVIADLIIFFNWKEYVKSLSPKGQLISNLIKNCLLGILAIIAAFWLVLYLGGNPYNEYMLITKGISTKGFITSVDETSTDTDQGTVFSYNYTFYFKTKQGENIKSWAKDDGMIPNELMDLTTPHPFDIVYLKDNPDINMPKDKICDSLGDFFWRKCGLGFCILLMFSSIGFILIRKAIKDFKIADKDLRS